MNEEMKFCQSCGMPMQTAGDFGTEADGGASADYCVYCYKNGAFTEACTMEEMIRHCAEFHDAQALEQITKADRKFRSVFVSAAELRYICPEKTTNAN